MERFVIGSAIFMAAVIAAGSYFGHAVSDEHGFRFEFGDTVEPGGSPATTAVTPYAATELRVRNAVAVLNVVPEDRTDITLQVSNPGRLPIPTVRLDGAELIVDGGLSGRRIQSCHTSISGYAVSVRGYENVTTAQMPVITAHVPRAVHLSVGGAVKTSVGPSTSADLGFAGCGDNTIGDVAGELKLDSSGSGDSVAGAALSAKVSGAGSGDMTVGAIAGKLEVSLAGSGGVTAASVNGPVDVSIAGSGDVTVKGGTMQDVDISVAGSGDTVLDGAVHDLKVSVAGSGDVTVSGAAANVEANIMGSGDVSVGSVTGAVKKAVMGSGSVTVGSR